MSLTTCESCEKEFLTEADPYVVLPKPSGTIVMCLKCATSVASKQAAREIEKHLLGMFWTIPYKENEPMIYRDQAIEWLRDKFGLEG